MNVPVELKVERDRWPSANSRPRLLVSVRSADEVESVIQSAVDIVDLKEPRAGALAPTSGELWSLAATRWIKIESDTTRPLWSAALGERDTAVNLASSLPNSFDFAKAGPSGCPDERRLFQLWSDVRRRLSDRIELVAVAYADWQSARCPAPETIFQLAHQFGLRRCLLDTYGKTGRSSVQVLGVPALQSLNQLASEFGLWWAMAGSIRTQDVATLHSHGVHPNCYGVRGDVCQDSREGVLCMDRVANWVNLLSGSVSHTNPSQ